MLIRLEAARLGFERCRAVTGPINLEVRPASTGGHALLGENGSGKTLIAQALLRRGGPLLRAGRVLCRDSEPVGANRAADSSPTASSPTASSRAKSGGWT